MFRTAKHLIMECLGRQSYLNCTDMEQLLSMAARASGATILQRHFHSFGHNQGITGVLMLAESHISVHTWPEHGYAAFDIFMCGNCQPEMAAEQIAGFDPEATINIRALERGIPEAAIVSDRSQC